MVQGVPGVWLDRPNVRYNDRIVSVAYNVYGRVGEEGVMQGVNNAFIRCCVGHCRLTSLLFLYILKLGLHVPRPSIDPGELDTVQCVV